MKACDLNKYIEHYLVADRTKSALMLTADWGSGKSYYIQNELIPYLEKNGSYHCIVVSLYGVTSTKDVSKSVYLEARAKKALAKSEKSTAGMLIAKTIVRGLTSAFGVEINADERDLQRLYESIDLSGKLIIFEDVERTQIDILEFLGYVNSLVEQDGAKVLLVTNESELLRRNPPKPDSDKTKKIAPPQVGEFTEKTQAYLRTKEKTISDTIVYEPSYSQAVKAIIGIFAGTRLSQFEADTSIKEICKFILDCNCINFRTFTFACQKTVDIFAQLPSDCAAEQYKTIFYSIIAFAARIKSGKFPEWVGTTHLSMELASSKYPLYRFCYNYIRWQTFEASNIDAAFEERRIHRLYEKNRSRHDVDLAVIDSYYIKSESEVIAALQSIEARLMNFEDISFYSYGMLALRLVQLKTILGFDYALCEERMAKNIHGRYKDIDGDLLFFISYEFSNDAEKAAYYSFRKNILTALHATDDGIDGFTYTPEAITTYYNTIIRTRSDIISSKKFISKFNLDKLEEMLMRCNSAQLQDFRDILFRNLSRCQD